MDLCPVLCPHVRTYISITIICVCTENGNSGMMWFCRCPARMDLSGGWTDTPPVSYEYGGVVVNVALLVNGKRPMSTAVRRISEPVLVLWTDSGAVDKTIKVTSMQELSDYANPFAPAALLKACLALFLESDAGSTPFPQLLQERFGGGLEVHTSSNLPVGSGLGGSSILAGCILKALCRSLGYVMSDEDLVHAVLRVESMLTCGGGWQDQVGGLYLGVKMCASAAQLPLTVSTEIIPLDTEFQHKLNQHICLIYTGRARLAKNLLQNVLRRWGARSQEILDTVSGLKRTAAKIREGFIKNDIAVVGECLGDYWAQKKCMASGGVEPASVTQMLQLFGPHIHGASLAGAGGGGFLLCVTREPNAQGLLQQIVADSQIDGKELIEFHKVELDMVGPTVEEVSEPAPGENAAESSPVMEAAGFSPVTPA